MIMSEFPNTICDTTKLIFFGVKICIISKNGKAHAYPWNNNLGREGCTLVAYDGQNFHMNWGDSHNRCFRLLKVTPASTLVCLMGGGGATSFWCSLRFAASNYFAASRCRKPEVQFLRKLFNSVSMGHLQSRNHIRFHQKMASVTFYLQQNFMIILFYVQTRYEHLKPVQINSRHSLPLRCESKGGKKLKANVNVALFWDTLYKYYKDFLNASKSGSEFLILNPLLKKPPMWHTIQHWILTVFFPTDHGLD